MERCRTSLFFVFVYFAIAACFEEDTLVPDLIRTAGYPYENHTVITDDGYIINVFRIPFGLKEDDAPKNRTPVLIVHGLFGYSLDYLLLGPKRALGYILADNGFDVWLMNCRGTRYSKRHVSLDASQSQYWNFTFHEIGVYDTPAVIDHMINTTGFEQIVHIGHSQGGTTFYIMCAERPEYNEKIKVHISYAPAVSFMHVKNPIFKNLAQIEASGGFSTVRQGSGDFDIGGYISGFCHVLRQLCDGFLVFFQSELDFFEYAKYLLFNYYPEGASSKQLIHFVQTYAWGFRPYANSAVNLPPLYDLKNVRCPVIVYYGQNDTAVDKKAVENFIDLIPGLKLSHLVPNWDHFDFLISLKAWSVIFQKTIDEINSL